MGESLRTACGISTIPIRQAGLVFMYLCVAYREDDGASYFWDIVLFSFLFPFAVVPEDTRAIGQACGAGEMLQRGDDGREDMLLAVLVWCRPRGRQPPAEA